MSAAADTQTGRGQRQQPGHVPAEAVAAGGATVNCPACGMAFRADEGERDALDAAVACEICHEEPAAARPGGLPAPVILTRCADCRVNHTAGEATEAGSLVCRPCLDLTLSADGQPS